MARTSKEATQNAWDMGIFTDDPNDILYWKDFAYKESTDLYDIFLHIKTKKQLTVSKGL